MHGEWRRWGDENKFVARVWWEIRVIFAVALWIKGPLASVPDLREHTCRLILTSFDSGFCMCHLALAFHGSCVIVLCFCVSLLLPDGVQ